MCFNLLNNAMCDFIFTRRACIFLVYKRRKIVLQCNEKKIIKTEWWLVNLGRAVTGKKKILKKFKLFPLCSLFLTVSMMHLSHRGCKVMYLFHGFWKSVGILLFPNLILQGRHIKLIILAHLLSVIPYSLFPNNLLFPWASSMSTSQDCQEAGQGKACQRGK